MCLCTLSSRRVLHLPPSHPRLTPTHPPRRQLYVGNLVKDVRESELEDVFKRFGRLNDSAWMGGVERARPPQ